MLTLLPILSVNIKCMTKKINCMNSRVRKYMNSGGMNSRRRTKLDGILYQIIEWEVECGRK